LGNLSLGRAQIAIDQIRSCLTDPSLGSLVLVTCVDSVETDTGLATIAVVIAVISPEGGESGLARSDTATIVHAGTTVDATSIDEPIQAAIVDELAAKTIDHFANRGVTFVQWATDPENVDSATDGLDWSDRWCRAFGLEPVANLDYLSGPVVASDRPKLTFTPFDWTPFDDAKPKDWASFADLIEQTYLDTRDCPSMSRFRSAEQTMAGYTSSAAMAGHFWFTATDPATPQADPEVPVGVLILGVHGSAQASDSDPSPIIEIVYMGLVPSARGRGLGRSLLNQAMAAARTIGAERLILAVDQNNSPANDHYRSAGLEPMLCERVWCGAVDSRG
jgi:ribosomal protein S18 acetylase RimI-like enzyme